MIKNKLAKAGRNVLFGIATFGLIGIASLVTTVNVSADDTDEEYQANIVSAEGVPDETHLVAKVAIKSEDEYIATLKQLIGEDKYNALVDLFSKMDEDEINEDDPRFFEMLFELYDEIGILDVSEDYVDFHLEDDDDKEVAYAGDGITIRYFFELDLENEDYKYIKDIIDKYSSKQWEYKLAHLKDDGSVEFLPVTISDGIWEFTAKDFSTYVPVLKAIEEPAPQTGDNITAYLGIVALSTLAVATYGFHIVKSHR